MKMKFVHIMSLLFLAFFVGCGQDQLSKDPLYANSLYANSLTDNASCGCDSQEYPTCGGSGKTYSNKCVAQCFGEKTFKVGHCECKDTRKVCLQKADGLHSKGECEALKEVNQGLGTILKFVSCDQISM